MLSPVLASGPNTFIAPRCERCNTLLVPTVLSCTSGHYIGTKCKCGVQSCESGFYATSFGACRALETGSYSL